MSGKVAELFPISLPALKEVQTQIVGIKYQNTQLKLLIFVADIIALGRKEYDVRNIWRCEIKYGEASNISLKKNKTKICVVNEKYLQIQ